MRTFFIISTLSLAAIAVASPQFGNFFNPVPNVVPQVADVIPQVQNLPGVGAISSLANNIPLLSNVKSFGEFVAQSGKQYATAAERSLREGIFAAKNKVVDANNQLFASGQSTFKLAHNFFSDLSKAEFLEKLTGNKKSPVGESKKKNRKAAPSGVNLPIPDEFDWRTKGGVTPVKFQGLECGACWSFGVTGAIEGHYFAKTNKLISMSEQNLIDCSRDFGNTGCDGGFQEYGFEYVIENKGIVSEDTYPYVELDGKCRYNSTQKVAQITGYGTIEPKNEKQMKAIIATKGPLVCSVNAGPDSFQLYESGLYTDDECNKDEVNHTILVVGYGVDKDGKDYWIIKNSWTSKWGEGGYMKLPRNSNNFCGIADECSYPII